MSPNPELLDAALAAAARGWRVFPVVPGRDKKTGKLSWKKPPFGRWPQLSTTDPDTIRGWYSRYRRTTGYGWHTQGYAALDFDIQNGAELLNAAGLDTPPTLTVRSGNAYEPWRHTIVYRLPPGRRLRVTALANFKALRGREKFRGIDVRSSGGMIVGPGSSHATGGRYTWDDREAAPAPEWLLDITEDEKEQYATVLTPAEAAALRRSGRSAARGRAGAIPPAGSDEELTDYLIARYPVDAPGARNQQQLLAVAWLMLVKKVPAERALRLVMKWLAHYRGSYATDLVSATREAEDMVRRTQEKMAAADLVTSPDHQRLTADSREHEESINRFMLSWSLQGAEAQFAEAVLLHYHYHREEVGLTGSLPLTDRQVIKVIEYRHGRSLSWNLFYRLKRDFFALAADDGAPRPARKRELLRTLEQGTHGIPSRYAVSEDVLRELGREASPCDEYRFQNLTLQEPEEPFWEELDDHQVAENPQVRWPGRQDPLDEYRALLDGGDAE